MSASPGHSYTNNILGNTTEINGIDLEWDELNRLTAMYNTAEETYWQYYEYRADGMRTQQVDINYSYTKRFRYDGQMPVETAAFNGTSSLTWTSTARNVLGARGIDALSTETSGGTVSTYPLFDTHGNVKAYVKKEASNTWSSLGWKQYNVWGGVRSTSGGAGTSSAYCGNLGHVSDEHTGLIYMRARYYAPWAGRFISEDKARDGLNWFSYCGNEPLNRIDPDGQDYVQIVRSLVQIFLFFAGSYLLGQWFNANAEVYRLTKYIAELESLLKDGIKVAGTWDDAKELRQALEVNKGLLSRAKGISAGQTLLRVLGYMMIVKAFLMDIDFGSDRSGLDILFGN